MRESRPSFASAIEHFFAAKRLAPSSERDYGRYLREFDAFTGSKDVETALTLDNATKWKAELMTRGRKGHSTARNGVRVIKSFATFAHDSRYLTGAVNVLARLRVPPEDREGPARERLTEIELREIWQALSMPDGSKRTKPERYRALAYVRLLHATGIRRDEARRLLLNDLHLKTGWVTVPSKTSKGAKEDMLLNGRTIAAIRDYLEHGRPKYTGGKVREPMFITEAGKPFTANGWGTWCDRIGDEIERLTPSGVQWSSDLMRVTWEWESVQELKDPELRSTCERLLKTAKHHDQAVREACVVLEDRVRKHIGGTDADYGTSLMEKAFGGNQPRIRLAAGNEQRGAMEIYRGVIAHYKNGTGHRLRYDFDPNEALRIVKWIDHLLWLIAP